MIEASVLPIAAGVTPALAAVAKPAANTALTKNDLIMIVFLPVRFSSNRVERQHKATKGMNRA
jgi:hypothetical protein